MHGMGPADGLNTGLGQPDITHLAGRDQIGHGSHGILNRYLNINAVLVARLDRLPVQVKAVVQTASGNG